uniref:Uncharacterized protein n=1 Tax=Ursus americanus TaxID=9643 RepID=A0A452SBG9_URSAM
MIIIYLKCLATFVEGIVRKLFTLPWLFLSLYFPSSHPFLLTSSPQAICFSLLFFPFLPFPPADSNRALLTRVYQQAYAHLYQVFLVKQDSSTIHIPCSEPRRVLEMASGPRCPDPRGEVGLVPKCEAQRRENKEEPELCDSFEVEQYKGLWIKK